MSIRYASASTATRPFSSGIAGSITLSHARTSWWSATHNQRWSGRTARDRLLPRHLVPPWAAAHDEVAGRLILRELTPSILPCAERDLAAFSPHVPLLDPPRSVPMPRIRHRRRLEPAIRPEARSRGGAPSRRACVNLSYSTLSPKKPSVAASSRIVRAENRSKRRYTESCCGRREPLNVTHQAEKGIAQGPRLVL